MASESTPGQTPEPAANTPAAPKPGFGERLANLARKRPFLFWSLVVVIILFIASFVMPSVPPPHVALGGEPISINTPSWLTNSILTTLIVDVIILLLALFTRMRLSLVPGGLQNLMEAMLEYIYGLAEQVAGKAARTYFPWVMTIFMLVLLSNWSGLIPGVGSIGVIQTHGEEHQEEEQNQDAPEQEGTPEPQGWNRGAQLAMANGALILLSPETKSVASPLAAEEGGERFVPTLRAPSADLNLTLALAITTMVMVQVWGVRALGGSYFKKFFNFSGKGAMIGINAFVGILELISEVARIISFSFRLYGNIFAGEIVLATMAFLVMYVIPVPFYLLEVLVGAVQALVFTMLALVFFSMATIGHHEEGHEHH